MNPIKGLMNSNNPINQLIGLLNSGQSPESLAKMIMKKNPQAAQMITMLQNSGKNPKDVAMRLCQDNGIDIAQLEELAKKFK